MTATLLQLTAAFTGALSFAFLFNMHRKKALVAALGGALAWLCYLTLFRMTKGEILSAYLATVIISFYAEFMARIMKSPATVFLIIGSIPLYPGASLYRTMNYLMQKDYSAFRLTGLSTILFSSAMAAGFVTVLILTRTFHIFSFRSRSRGC